MPDQLVYLCGYPAVITRKRIKNIILRVKNSEGLLAVSLPHRAGLGEAERVVADHRAWIERMRARHVQEAPLHERGFESGELVYLWGEPRLLRWNDEPLPQSAVQAGLPVLDLKLRACASTRMTPAERREKALLRFYAEELRTKSRQRLPLLRRHMGCPEVECVFKNMKSRWGSCQPKKRLICLNIQLARYAPELLDYILVHELAHLYESGHGPRFYAIMDRALPDWKERRKRLREALPGEGTKPRKKAEKA